MKTIFLDFDGVLHPTLADETERLGRAHLLVPCIARWMPQIVISSSWRFHFSLDQIMSSLQVAISHRIVGVTGAAHIGKHAHWNEINNYCATNKVIQWRALDDGAFEFPDGCKELIHCKGGVGLTSLQIGALEEWLNS